MFFYDDPIQHILFCFFAFFYYYFLVVLTCVTVQLDLLLQWYGHRMNFLWKKMVKIDMHKILEGQIRTAYLELENV